MGIATNDFNQPPLIRTLKRVNPAKGDPICYSGAHAGLVCGELVQTPIGGVTSRVNP